METIQLLTKSDLEEFKKDLIQEIKKVSQPQEIHPKQWLKSIEVRKLLNISPGTLQNLRVNGSLPYTRDISRGRGSEYNRTPEYLAIQAKLRWRAYQLGYKFDLFGKLDIEIAKYQHWGEEFASTERYADKYIEIAFLEYCGYLDGLNDLESFDDIGYLRTFKLKHDPTEAEDADEE